MTEDGVTEEPVTEGGVTESGAAKDPVTEDPVAKGAVAKGAVTEDGAAEDAAAEGGPSAAPVISWMGKDDHEKLVAHRLAGHRGRHRRRPRRSSMSRGAGAAVVAAAGLSGAATVGSATGAPAMDRVLRGGLAATITAAAATAPTWAVVVLATGAAALGWTGGPLAAASGSAALVLALVLSAKEDVDRNLLKSASGGLAATALLRVPGGVLGATAAATAVLAGLIVLTGLRGGGRRWRRRATLAAAGLMGLAALATVLGALAGLGARGSFERSSAAVASSLSAAKAGDAAGAAGSARAAAADLRRARTSVRVWWARPAWAVPIVGAHLRAADQVADTAGPAVESAAGSADALRVDVLRPAPGRLDLDAVAAAEPRLAGLSGALHAAERGSARARSPWLLAPLQGRLDSYDAQLGDLTVTADRALLAVRTVPGLLGRDRPTRWFVAVANPAESRELGGFLGDYAVVIADRGRLHLERSGGVSDLGASVAGRDLGGLDLPRRYADQQPELYWQNLTGYPDLPTVAATARVLWDQQEPGFPLDGVAYVDPEGLAALLRLTGPVEVAEPIGTISADNAADLLLSGQYTRFNEQDQRHDALQDVATATFSALSTASLPGPEAVGAALGPAARAGHLVATSFSAEGQRLFDDVGAGGRLPTADGGDLASLRTTNLVENKLDVHVQRSVRYRAVVDPANHRVEATATISLRSDATAELPDYVAANRRGLPKGTDLLEVAWYSGLGLQDVEVDGRPATATSDQERGWWTHSTTIQVPPGGSTTVVLHLAGKLGSTSPYRLAVAPQAAAQDDDYALEVVGGRGWTAGPVRQPERARSTDLLVTMKRR